MNKQRYLEMRKAEEWFGEKYGGIADWRCVVVEGDAGPHFWFISLKNPKLV